MYYKIEVWVHNNMFIDMASSEEEAKKRQFNYESNGFTAIIVEVYE